MANNDQKILSYFYNYNGNPFFLDVPEANGVKGTPVTAENKDAIEAYANSLSAAKDHKEVKEGTKLDTKWLANFLNRYGNPVGVVRPEPIKPGLIKVPVKPKKAKLYSNNNKLYVFLFLSFIALLIGIAKYSGDKIECIKGFTEQPNLACKPSLLDQEFKQKLSEVILPDYKDLYSGSREDLISLKKSTNTYCNLRKKKVSKEDITRELVENTKINKLILLSISIGVPIYCPEFANDFQ